MRSARSLLLAVAAVMGVATVAGCSGAASRDSAEELSGMPYSTVDGKDLLADGCLAPPTGGGAPAIVLLHGGGFEEGGRASSGMPELCTTLAAAGYSAFSIDYRLLPESSFPDQVDDAGAAVAWLREPEQVERFDIDPDRIGVFGSSAGAIIAQGLGTAGSGSLESGSRVSAVVSMSGASDFTENGLTLGRPTVEVQKLILAYLGCSTLTSCPVARDASPLYSVTGDDSPMILLNSTEEIVPEQQSEAMAGALKKAGVTTELVITGGSKHGISALTSANMVKIQRFLVDTL